VLFRSNLFKIAEPYSWKNDNFNTQLYEILHFESNVSQFSNFGKAQYYFRRAELFSSLSHIFDDAIFNYREFGRNKPCYLDFHNTYQNYKISQKIEFDFLLRGTEMIINDYKKAQEISETKKHKTFVDFCLLEYARKSRLISRVGRRFEIDTLYTPIKLEYLHDVPKFLSSLENDSLTTKVNQLLNILYDSYQKTKFNGDQNYISITPSANLKYDQLGLWYGGEIALDFVNERYLYKFKRIFNSENFSRRITAFHVGFNMNDKTRAINEFYFGTFRRSDIYGVYFKIIQFGFIQNLNETRRNAWFYRPQIGFNIGHFQLFYSYTAVFNKELRQLAPKHAINLRFSMPYFRISRYDRDWLWSMN
jgi:hypothetical protein